MRKRKFFNLIFIYNTAKSKFLGLRIEYGVTSLEYTEQIELELWNSGLKISLAKNYYYNKFHSHLFCNHHQSMPTAQIPLTISSHLFLLTLVLGKSSRRQPVSV